MYHANEIKILSDLLTNNEEVIDTYTVDKAKVLLDYINHPEKAGADARMVLLATQIIKSFMKSDMAQDAFEDVEIEGINDHMNELEKFCS